MSVLLDALKSIEDMRRLHLEQPGSTDSVTWRDSVVDELGRLIALRATAAAAGPVSEALAAYLQTSFASKLAEQKPVSILTLSESATVTHCLRHAALKSAIALDSASSSLARCLRV